MKKTLTTDAWQQLVSLGVAEVKALLTAYKLQVTAVSPLSAAAAAAFAGAGALDAAKTQLQKRGLLEATGVKPGAELLAVKGALEVLARPSLELMVVKLKPTASQPQSLTFAIGAQQSCLFFLSAEGLEVGAAIPNTQLFSILSRDLKGAKDDDFKPWEVLPMHYQLLLAVRHVGLLNKKSFPKDALVALVSALELDAKESAALITSAVKAGVLVREGAGFSVARAAAALMEKLSSGEMTELVVRELTARPGALPKSILFAGAAGQRIRCDRPAANAASKSIPVLTFVPVTPESLGASVGKWLGLSN